MGKKEDFKRLSAWLATIDCKTAHFHDTANRVLDLLDAKYGENSYSITNVYDESCMIQGNDVNALRIRVYAREITAVR